MKNTNINTISYTFSNGVTVVNATPRPLDFLSPEGEKVVIPTSLTSVSKGERTGNFVINATTKTIDIGFHNVTTKFNPSDEGNKIISEITSWANAQGINPHDLKIVGSLIAAQAYPGQVVGMVPAPGFERVPSSDKLMSSDRFTVY